MPLLLCPTCHRANSAQEWRCTACGTSLAPLESDTQPAAFYPQDGAEIPAWPEHGEGAVWLEDLARDKASPALVRAGAMLSLRDVDVPLPAPADPPAEPTPPGLVVSDGVPTSPAVPASAEALARRQALEKLKSDAQQARARAKAAKRAEVRRAQRRHDSHGEQGTAAQEAAVLVVDADADARESLCALLGMFGFAVYTADSVEEATMQLDIRDFVAAFVDLPLDGTDEGAGVALCKRLKSAVAAPGAAPPALVLVQTSERASDRVLARLAGCDGMLQKPVARGDVARTLESCGVAMPSDARRG